MPPKHPYTPSSPPKRKSNGEAMAVAAEHRRPPLIPVSQLAGPHAGPGAGQGPSILQDHVLIIVVGVGYGQQSTGTKHGAGAAQSLPPHPGVNAKDEVAAKTISDKILRTTKVLLTIPSSSFHQSLFKGSLNTRFGLPPNKL
jgi:hypothetical protein